MLKSDSIETEESNLALLGDFKKKEDIKLYRHLPDYDDFQGYDMGEEGDILRQAPLRIYDNFHKPSWQTLKHHLYAVKIPKNFPRQ